MTPGQPPLPLTIVTGYLGAGKTTLVNHLLGHADDRRIMVLVNDFGEIAIDADLIVARDADTLTLANGCVCCSIGGDLFRAFAMALDRTPRPDHLVIEASGVADAARLADIARAEPDMRLDCVVTVADAETVRERCLDPYVGETVAGQLHAADLIVVNKIDYTEPAGLQAVTDWLGTSIPETPVVLTSHCLVDADVVLGPTAGSVEQRGMREGDHSNDADHGRHNGHEDTYVRWLSRPNLSFTRAGLDTVLRRLPAGLLRLKGFVRITDDDRMVVVQVVGTRVEVSEPAPPSKTSQLTGIGLRANLDTGALDALFSQA